MQVNIQSSFRVKGNLNEAIEEQLQKLTKYNNRIVHADVYLRKEDSEPEENSEIKVKLSVPGPDIVVSDKSDSFEKSLKTVYQGLKRQLLRNKD